MSIKFRKAIEEEVRVLTDMSRDAFLSDVAVGKEHIPEFDLILYEKKV